MKRDDKVDVYISEEKIANRVKELGEKISHDYKDEEIIVVTILKGSFVFSSDLVRKITSPIQCEFLSCSSYGDSTESSGELKINSKIDRDFTGKNVLIVEDIIDTGLTMKKLLEYFKEKKCKECENRIFFI